MLCVTHCTKQKRGVRVFFNLGEVLGSLSILLVSVCLKNVLFDHCSMEAGLHTHDLPQGILVLFVVWGFFFPVLPAFYPHGPSACEQDRFYSVFSFTLTVPHTNWLLVSVARKLARDLQILLRKWQYSDLVEKSQLLICVLL